MAGKPKVQIFNESELLTPEQAEAEEFGGSPAVEEPSSEPVPAEPAEPAPAPSEPSEPQPEPQQLSERTQERIRRLVEENKIKERELAEFREKWARLDERRNQVAEAAKQAREQAAEAERLAQRPDPSIDPTGARIWDLEERDRRREAEFRAIQQKFNETTGTLQQTQQQTDFQNWVAFEAQNFARQQPDYFDAAKHAFQWRVNWWKSIAPNAPDELVQGIVQRESEALAVLARQHGGSFPQAVYALAKQVGFNAPVPAMPANGATNGTVKATATSPQAVSNAAKLLQAQAGQKMQGLGRVNGAGSEATSRYEAMSATDLYTLPEAEWSALCANPQTRIILAKKIAESDGISVEEAMRAVTPK